MRQPGDARWIQELIKFSQWYWISLTVGIVATFAVFGVWQQLLLQEKLYLEQVIKQAVILVYGADWQEKILPISAFLAESHSPCSTLFLWGASLGVWTLAFIVYLGQQLVSQTQQVRQVNQQLQDEIVHRQQVEKRKQSDIALQENESKYRKLIDRMNAGAIVHAPDTRILYCNAVACKILELSPDQMTGKEPLDATSRLVREDGTVMPVAEYPVNLVLSTQAPLENYIVGIQRKDRPCSWILVTAFPEFDANNCMKEVVVIFVDISRFKQVEIELREMTMVLENARSGIFKLDSQGCYLYVNKLYAEIAGYEPDRMVGMSWYQTVHPDDLEKVKLAYQRLVQEGKVEVEFKGICQGGTPFYQHLLTIATYDEKQQFIGNYGFMRDITDRKQAEAAFEKELQQSTLLLNTSRDGIVILNHQGDVMKTSPSFAEMIGYTVEETMQLNVADWDAQWTREELQQIRESMQIPPRLETRHRRKDGSLHDVEISYSRVDQDGETIHFCICRDISDRKAFEEALQQSESILRSFFNSGAMLMGIVELHDRDILHLSDNQAAAKFFGTTPEAMQNHFASEMGIYQTYLPQWLDRYREAERTQTPVRFEYLHETPTVRYWLAASVCQIVTDSSQYPNFSYIIEDISERKQTEIELRESEATKQAIIQAIPDLLIRMQADGSYVEFISNSSFNIVSPEQTRAHATVYDILPEDLAQLRMYYTRQALATGTTQVYEQEIVIQGNHCYEEVRVVPLLLDEVLVMVRDITDRKQAEKELQHQQEMFQGIINHIPVMIALFKENGHIEFVNPELENVLGWSLEDWYQRDIFSECYPDPVYRQSVIEHMLAIDGKWKDFTTLTKTGQRLESSWINVRLSNGSNLGIGQDISDRKRKEIALQQAMEAAEAANLAKSLFLANMSHELRTPLNVILGFAQVMAHDPSLTPNQQKDLETIRRSGDHLLSLINDVLDLSKIESGHCTLEESGFDLIALLHSLRNMFVERASSKGLELTFQMSPEVPQFIVADAQKLRQVLLNLLSNAIKFTHQGSITLEVRCEASNPQAVPSTPHQLCFAVIDTGVGIAPEEITGIFDAFVQAKAGKSSVSGTGLGLTISRKLLQLMGGEITVSSILGQGSTFSFTLPVTPTAEVTLSCEPTDRWVMGLAPGQRHYRILVVDDRSENRLLMIRLLAQLGLEVREASNGREAVQLWQEWRPDLTWMDIRMPVLDGYEATKQIRAMEQGQNSIIIALTAQASESDRTTALAAGCNDYISKPFREQTLFLKMAQYLGLEYCYAESDAPSNRESHPHSSSANETLESLQLNLLPTLPQEWLVALEDAAVCGNDGAIVSLLAQLPPELNQLAIYFKELAEKYEFETLLQRLKANSSTGEEIENRE